MNDVIKNGLDAICSTGKVIKWQGNLYEPQKWKNVNGKIVIVANPKSIQLDFSTVHDFVEEIEVKEISDKIVVKNPSNKLLDSFGPVDYDTLNSGLMSAFKKVEDDAEFIPKAKQMCDIVNSVTKLQKTKIELLKLAR